MSIEDDKNLHPLVSERLPQFVRVQHPTLVAFLSAYYEWLDLRRDSGVILSPMALKDVVDIDTTMNQFVEMFKKEYLFGFPESLALSKETGNPVNTKNLLKNIKQFYKAKGTEKAYEFLFRILYDTSVEFYYPKTDILKLSSGRWVQNNYIRTSNTIGDSIYRAAGNTVVQKNKSGSIIATAKVINVTVYQKGNFTVAELLISGRNGTFRTETGIEFADGPDTFVEPKIYSVVSSVNILNGGSDYQVGDDVVFSPAVGDAGQKARGTVREVNSAGSIRSITIDDFGINYELTPSVAVSSRSGSGFSGTANIGALCQQAGFYSGSDGLLSSSKVLQDNHYYQNWSYVLKSEIVVDRYREIIRKLVHPVGTGMFGQVQIKRCLKEDIDNSITLMSYEVPLIGNYMPYTFYTFDNLGDWFKDPPKSGLTERYGYNPLYHDSVISAPGPYGPGNPISNEYRFRATEHSIPHPSITGHTGPEHDMPPFPENGESYWFTYDHPNKKVSGSHLVKVWSDQVQDFKNWNEWELLGNGESAVSEWLDQANGLVKNPLNCCHGFENWRSHESFKYASLKYNTQSAFRKISARSFFEMPMGQFFDCKDTKLGLGSDFPQIEFTYPLNGELIYGGYGSNVRERDIDAGGIEYWRGMGVKYNVKNPQSLSRLNLTGIRISLDSGRGVGTLKDGSILNSNFWFENILDGRHYLRAVFVDSDGKEYKDSEKNIMFYYQYEPPQTGVPATLGTGPSITNQYRREFVLDSGLNETDNRAPVNTQITTVYGKDTNNTLFNPDSLEQL